MFGTLYFISFTLKSVSLSVKEVQGLYIQIQYTEYYDQGGLELKSLNTLQEVGKWGTTCLELYVFSSGPDFVCLCYCLLLPFCLKGSFKFPIKTNFIFTIQSIVILCVLG